jgi:16S rRNA (cytidine1402-2'-O)-methyltransferase
VCNDHTELSRVADALGVLAGGRDVAIVSDAGTPGISDPGERIVRAAIDAGYDVSAVPGPSAAIMALTISGLAADRFVFEGFIPRKGNDRAARLAEIAAERRTTVIYEAPHRVLRTLEDLRVACGDDRLVVVARELTKLYEEVVRGPLGTVDIGGPRGEYVLVLEGAPVDERPASDDEVRDALRGELAAGSSTRDAAAAVARDVGRPKREVYALAVGLDNAKGGGSDE